MDIRNNGQMIEFGLDSDELHWANMMFTSFDNWSPTALAVRSARTDLLADCKVRGIKPEQAPDLTWFDAAHAGEVAGALSNFLTDDDSLLGALRAKPPYNPNSAKFVTALFMQEKAENTKAQLESLAQQ